MAVSDHIVVMNQGSIVQEGTAEDLYHRPASEFVATFVGRVNLISGTVTGRSGERASVSALGRTFQARVGAVTLDVGARTRLVLRPEAIAISRGSDGLPARVTMRTFLGDKVEYRLRCSDTELQAIRHSSGADNAIGVGDDVALQFADEALVALPETDR
jgi:ABC-type Fe3+/spermidine/putrescine transport system ATPase subunit